jgi:transposase-like protein
VEADRLVAEFEDSGQSRREFSQARGISIHTLDAWRRRAGRSRPGAAILPVELVAGHAARDANLSCTERDPRRQERAREFLEPVVGEDMRRALCVVLASGRRVEVGAGFDAAELKRLIAALEAV